ncbi:hypothetical protein D3C77_765170 [compost metagenome]
MATQPGVVAHDANVHGIADVDTTELGFFEVAVDVVRGAVDHRQHRAAGGDEFVVTRRAVVEVAIDRAAHH